jgi:polyvinyl alcohol dehydrogenase (cytochrome)
VNADPPGVDPIMDHQRPAMALSNGRLYWGYGGAECGSYKGKVVSFKTDGTDPRVHVLPTVNGGSLWAPPGPSIDPQGNVWVATAESTVTPTTFDETDAVLKLSPTLDLLGYFAPSNWATLGTKEIGSTSPVMLAGGYVYQEGKNGTGYVIRQANPGGMGGQAATVSVGCNASGGNSTSPGWIYVECLSGGPAGIAYDSSVPSAHVVWRGPSDANGSPTFGGNSLWVMGVTSGNLYALNTTTGAVRQTLNIGTARNFTNPIIANDTLIVATFQTVQAFRHVSG